MKEIWNYKQKSSVEINRKHPEHHILQSQNNMTFNLTLGDIAELRGKKMCIFIQINVSMCKLANLI